MENLKQDSTNKPPERPTGRLPEWQLWQTKMRSENGKMVPAGFTDAEGKYTELKPGEEFVVNRHENGDRTAVLRHADGTMDILKKWSLDEKYKV